ncbi:hypothetical protein BKA93DRAFT_798022 [Sparassis latifolia]|uniref:Nucleoporin nup45 n=1 Tax=Sparassis crispa TaxID=139825 RepID=A0A401H0I7_9APHY|nr:Nucleoporin nup45 [Sparassis crispa]GBE87899.1 Nucleoporin nup45 [Sparassis crispa]
MSFGSWGQPQQSTNPLLSQSNPPKPANPLFGSSQPGTSAFGAQNQGQVSSQAPSLFGAPLGQTQQPQGQAPTQTTSFFGAPISQQRTQLSSSLLGSNFGQNQQQQQPQQQVPSNFFSQPPTNTQPSSIGSIGSLFGNTQNQPTGQTGQIGQTGQQQGAYGLGLLGSNANANTSTLGQTSGFGNWGSNPLQAQPTQTASAFGATTGPSLFGRQPSQQPTFGANQLPATPPFTKSTRFNDLPDEVKRVFENIDGQIQGRIQISNDLKQRKLGEEAVKGQEVVRSVHKDLLSAITTLHSDVLRTRDLKAKVDQTVQDTIIATRIVDGFRNPQQYGVHLKNHADFPLEFFNRVTEQMRERLRWYKATIEQIERKLSSAATQSQYTPQAISSTLEAQHATFVALASKTAALDAELQKIKALYTQLWRARTGSMRDPFNELDRGSGGEFGLESINAK